MVPAILCSLVGADTNHLSAVIGLGNPGPRYKNTRHNVGWHVLDRLAARWEAGKPRKARHAEVLPAAFDGRPVQLVKPLTYMNDSGKAVRALVQKDHIPLERILVVYDDLDLAFGRLRLRAGGSSGGHNGIKSIQQHVAGKPGDFPRIKVGIGRPPGGVDPIDYVLTTFRPEEKLVISERTVKFHVSAILAKLDVGNRTEAVSKAAQLGLVDL